MLKCVVVMMIKFSIIPVLGVLFLISCSEEKKESRIEVPDSRDERIASLEVEIRELKAEAQRERDQFRIQSEANTVVMGQLKEVLVGLKEQAEAKSETVMEPLSGVDSRVKERDDLEERRRVLDAIRMARLVAVGEEHELIVTDRGEPFYDVVITEVNEIGISMRHRGGAGRIAFEDLPESWQVRFGYDRERAAKALEREQIFQAKYELSASKEMLAQKEKNERLERELREAQLALAVAQASQPAVVVADQDPDFIPVRQTIIHDHYPSRPILDVPILNVPVISGGGSSAYCPPAPQTYPQTQGSRPGQRPASSQPSVQRPVHNEAVTRPPITRPPSGSSSSPAQRPASSQPAVQVQRPTPSHNGAVSRPSIMRPPGH